MVFTIDKELEINDFWVHLNDGNFELCQFVIDLLKNDNPYDDDALKLQEELNMEIAIREAWEKGSEDGVDLWQK